MQYNFTYWLGWIFLLSAGTYIGILYTNRKNKPNKDQLQKFQSVKSGHWEEVKNIFTNEPENSLRYFASLHGINIAKEATEAKYLYGILVNEDTPLERVLDPEKENELTRDEMLLKAVIHKWDDLSRADILKAESLEDSLISLTNCRRPCSLFSDTVEGLVNRADKFELLIQYVQFLQDLETFEGETSLYFHDYKIAANKAILAAETVDDVKKLFELNVEEHGEELRHLLYKRWAELETSRKELSLIMSLTEEDSEEWYIAYDKLASLTTKRKL
ncbi:MAG: hypothetical protein M3Q24_00595 [bacterium]|nr:hypothetical protein [bacterium]